MWTNASPRAIPGICAKNDLLGHETQRLVYQWVRYGIVEPFNVVNSRHGIAAERRFPDDNPHQGDITQPPFLIILRNSFSVFTLLSLLIFPFHIATTGCNFPVQRKNRRYLNISHCLNKAALGNGDNAFSVNSLKMLPLCAGRYVNPFKIQHQFVAPTFTGKCLNAGHDLRCLVLHSPIKEMGSSIKVSPGSGKNETVAHAFHASTDLYRDPHSSCEHFLRPHVELQFSPGATGVTQTFKRS